MECEENMDLGLPAWNVIDLNVLGFVVGYGLLGTRCNRNISGRPCCLNENQVLLVQKSDNVQEVIRAYKFCAKIFKKCSIQLF